MGDNVLMGNEVEFYITNMIPSKLDDIGSKSWVEWHQRLQKLNQQALLEAKEVKEEFVKETLVACDKIGVLVYEAILLSVWRTKILPRLLKLQPDPENTFLIYSALYHEATAVALLETVLFHSDSCEVLQDNAIDLLDYTYEAITKLLVLKLKQDKVSDKELKDNNFEAIYKNEFTRQRDSLLFDIGMRCISILFHLATNLDRLPLSTTTRMFQTNDVPLLLVQLVEEKPWMRVTSNGDTKKYIEGKWQTVSGEGVIKVSGTEAQIWLCLRQLLLDTNCANMYDFSEFRKSQLMRLQKYMSDSILDQISPLGELKYWLCHLGVTNPPTNTKSNIILEVIPQIKQSILDYGSRKWKTLTNRHAQRFFNTDRKQLTELAQTLSDAYNTDFLERMDQAYANVCAGCGLEGHKKCSQCKNEWYCGRECQVKHWPQHKESCNKSKETKKP